MAKLFGTDGIRGVANRELTPEMAFRVGRITAALLSESHDRPVFLIGRDTRLSGGMLEGALSAGIASTGVHVGLLGVLSTPALAFLTRHLKAAAGVIISASHNPIEDNGLKIFNGQGYKLPDILEKQIEDLYFTGEDNFPRAVGQAVGQIYCEQGAVDHYLAYLKEEAPDLSGLRLVVDCGHGAACSLAPELLRSLGATVKLLHGTPDGSSINVNCGATNPGDLRREVLAEAADLGLAFDGDADRLIAVDDQGQVVDGDAILAVCTLALLPAGRLKKDTLVVTVMSNGGLELLGMQRGFRVVRTPVGDRFILEKMLEAGLNLGGEQSGHIIFADRATTGDGILTALELLKVLKQAGRPLSELASCLVRLPQVLVNRQVATASRWQDNRKITMAIEEVKESIGRCGRILVRASGTEPLIRIMVEATLTEEELHRHANGLAEIIAAELGAN